MTSVEPESEDLDSGVEVSDLLAAAETEFWPLGEQLRELETIDPDEVLNAEKLGSLRFVGADTQFQEILGIFETCAWRTGTRSPRTPWGEVQGHAGGLLSTVQQMAQLDPTTNADYQSVRDSLQRQFTDHYTFFRDRVRPLCLTAKLIHVLRTAATYGAGIFHPSVWDNPQPITGQSEGPAPSRETTPGPHQQPI